jgi:dihydrofolate synthase/folylpolyglutamate synthase
MQNLHTWLAHLESLHPKGQAGIVLGLERVRLVAGELDQRPFCPLIVVAGTNGKGSTCAYIESIYRAAGYRTGLYTSPHLLRYNERVRIDSAAIDDDSLCRAFARVESARQSAGNVALTYFEFGTLAAWEIFAEAKPDLLILEVGLGGRLDAVNLYDADVAIVTGIALDHTDYLGPTREAIALEKAGIFRPGRPALCADPAAPPTLINHAETLGASLRLVGRDFGCRATLDNRAQWQYWSVNAGKSVRQNFAYPGLRGEKQLLNAAAALAAVEALSDRLPLAWSAMRRGLVETELAGRFQVMPGRPAEVFDVAHNPQATQVLADNLSGMGYFDHTFAVVGMLGDKDLPNALKPLLGRVDHWFLTPLSSPRDAGPDALKAALASIGNQAPITVCDSVAVACRCAASAAGETDRILTFGSFLTVADALRWRSGRATGA